MQDAYDLDEAKTFVAQKLFKVDNIICDQQTKLLLIEKMVLCPTAKSSSAEYEQLKAKYGYFCYFYAEQLLIEIL